MRKTTLALALLTSLVLTGCFGRFKEMITESQTAQTAIAERFHVTASVSFRDTHGTNGSQLSVTVQLSPVPAGDGATIKSEVEKIVRASFKEPVDTVSVSY